MARPVTQGIPQDWTLHSTNSQMPISLLVELYKVAKERFLLTLRHTVDDKTGGADGTQVRTGMVSVASRGTSQKNSQALINISLYNSR